jgi:hypothetical protein
MTLLAWVGTLCFPQYAFAYIDPGTGSYVFQIIIAAFAAAAFMIKIYWHKIRSFVGRLFYKKER